MERLDNIHPGEILKEDFLDPLGITAYKLAKDLHIPDTRVYSIIAGKRSITPDTAIRLAKYFNTTVDLWLNLQRSYDIEETEQQHRGEYLLIPTCSELKMKRAL